MTAQPQGKAQMAGRPSPPLASPPALMAELCSACPPSARPPALMAELSSACPRRVLIVRLDAIGDYILFRNVLRFIRHSAAYRDAHITMLGNPACRKPPARGQ